MVSDLPDLLTPGDRLVLNDTRVLPARLSGTRLRESKDGGGAARIEVTLLDPVADGSGDWTALVKPLRKLRDGERVTFAPGFSATLIGREADGQARLSFEAAPDFDSALARVGAMPLPPYIAARRKADDRDREEYQTVWARRPGAVAAPTGEPRPAITPGVGRSLAIGERPFERGCGRCCASGHGVGRPEPPAGPSGRRHLSSRRARGGALCRGGAFEFQGLAPTFRPRVAVGAVAASIQELCQTWGGRATRGGIGRSR